VGISTPCPRRPGATLRTTGAVGWLLILHAYASGTTALTGVEAISNGISVFRPVEWRNARKVLMWMGDDPGAELRVHHRPRLEAASHPHRPQDARQRGGSGAVSAPAWQGRIALLILQVATTGILVLAANTSFSDFPPPRHAFHAGDGYLPRPPLMRRGSRLVFSTASWRSPHWPRWSCWWSAADVHRLIPLYAVGVFASFTFLPGGDDPAPLAPCVSRGGRPRPFAINATGSVGSALALVAILVTKFTHGAWVVAIVVPTGVGLFVGIHRHYERADAWLSAPGHRPGRLAASPDPGHGEPP